MPSMEVFKSIQLEIRITLKPTRTRVQGVSNPKTLLILEKNYINLAP